MQLKIESKSALDPERRAAVAIARALLPGNDEMEGAGLKTVLHAESFISKVAPVALAGWRQAHLAVSEAARLVKGKPLHELSPEEAEDVIDHWASVPVIKNILYGFSTVYKVAHFDLPDLKGSLPTFRVIQNPERARWESQIVRGEDLD